MPHCDLPPGATGAAYCGHCGLPLTEGRHEACPRRLELEPPRYCRRCRRRMVVQVTPDRWIAQCVEHGETTALTWADAAAASGRPTR